MTAAAHMQAVGAPPEDRQALEALLGRPIDAAERVGAGRNSRVYRVTCGREDYAAKFYFKPTADGRDRLEAEFNGLRFLWRNGVRSIAEPLQADRGRQLALYGFIEGATVDAAVASGADVAQVIEFLRELKDIAAFPEAQKIGPAAEAFFTISGVIGNVGQRLDRLLALDAQGPAYDALRSYLGSEFVPAFQSLSRRALQSGDRELPSALRTLSPSDLGFHNALRTPAGRLVFLDFEYFGWDDPAKTVSDALLHPLMRLSEVRQKELASGFDKVFGAEPGWRQRVEALYPLFALKWCMIMLNEFRPEQIERRRYVDRAAEEVHVIQMRQLEAARALLSRTTGEFPYWGQGK